MARTSNLEKHANYGIPNDSVKSVRQAPNNAKERTHYLHPQGRSEPNWQSDMICKRNIGMEWPIRARDVKDVTQLVGQPE
jgi:hypothetical protein